MADFEPTTDIKLLAVPLANDGESTLTFSSKSAQSAYFSSKVVGSFSKGDFTYQRKDNTMRVPWNAEKLFNVNYCMYKNANFGDKWFYAFINRVEYVAPNCTKLYLQTDVWQTWLFDITYGQCFVEREHVNSDKIGEHTIPESVTPSEWNLQKIGIDESPYQIGGYVVGTLYDIDSTVGNPQKVGGRKANGVYFPCDVLFFPNTEVGITQLQARLEVINDELSGGIVFVATIPKLASDKLTTTDSRVTTTTYSTFDNISVPVEHTNVSGYVPKNNKCYTYPYHYLVCSNSANGGSELRFENFKNISDITFTAYAHITENNCIQFVPVNYDVGTSTGDNPDFGFNSQTYPELPYTTNQNAYYRQQEMNLRNQNMNRIMSQTRGVVGSITTGGASLLGMSMQGEGTGSDISSYGVSQVSGIDSLYTNVKSAEMAEKNLEKMHQMTAPNVSGIGGSSDISVVNGNIAPRFYIKNAKKDQIKAIDQFFSAFGYQVNQLKKPNIKGRLNWNYVRCSQANVYADIPQEDLLKIKRDLVNGITFWHNPNTIYDYSKGNEVS